MAYAKRFTDGGAPLPRGNEFLTALRGGDLDRSEHLLIELPESLPDHLLRGVAELHMLRERWDQAELTLSKLHKPDADAGMRQRLCRNLTSLREHRPEAYKAIADAEPGEQYELIASNSGSTTIAYRHDEKRKTVLSESGDPTASVTKVIHAIADAQAAGKALGLLGIGDGYVLAHLARNAPKLFLGRQQAIALYEPDARLVLACLMIHDYTGPDGPIEQRRIQWYVGPHWPRQLRRKCLADLMIPYPQITLRLGLSATEIQKELHLFLQEVAALDNRMRLQVQSYYQHLTRDELVNVLGSKPYRKPRVMVITTRFSTVLQFSARDTAEAFEQLGWESLLIIEPTPAHALNRMAIRQALGRFRPDLVFQIDHLRREWGDLFPSSLPSVCWVQDHLPNLTNVSAGQSVQGREFVLIPSVQRYVSNYRYPADNCLEFRKLTRVPPRPAKWTSDGDDLVYVSNWSQKPETIAADVVRDLSQVAPANLISECCQTMIDSYAAGGTLHTPGDVRRVLEKILAAREMAARDESAQLTVITALFERMNNVLYRQQGLTWATEVAEQRGLRLSLYGNGWGDHPRFAKYSRGYASYGAGLEELSRRSKINLVLEPYVCVTHQRLLDCLVAGGFVLSRAHPQTDVVQSLIDLMADERSDDKLQETIDASSRADATPGRFDPIKTLRALQDSGFLPERGLMLPQLRETTFNSAAELGERVEQFLSNPDLRRSIASEQSRAVETRYSYQAGLQNMIEWICDRLNCEELAMKLAG
jgi:hypothetical protein